MDLFPELSNNYYALTCIPIGILLFSSFIIYRLGLRATSSIGLGILLSLISILILHQFHFENGKLVHQVGNLYVSIYTVTSILLLIIIVCFLTLKNPNNNCCCHEGCRKKGPEYLYDQDRTENSVDVHGYNSPKMEDYKDEILEHSTDNIHPGVENYSQSKFIGGFKNKGNLDGIQIDDKEWTNEVIAIKIEETSEPRISEVNYETEGLIYEYESPKTFNNSEDEGD